MKVFFLFVWLGEISQLNGDFGKLQTQLQGCQGSLNTLNKKFTYEM